jgi:hypothetical protein
MKKRAFVWWELLCTGLWMVLLGMLPLAFALYEAAQWLDDRTPGEAWLRRWWGVSYFFEILVRLAQRQALPPGRCPHRGQSGRARGRLLRRVDPPSAASRRPWQRSLTASSDTAACQPG